MATSRELETHFLATLSELSDVRFIDDTLVVTMGFPTPVHLLPLRTLGKTNFGIRKPDIFSNLALRNSSIDK